MAYLRQQGHAQQWQRQRTMAEKARFRFLAAGGLAIGKHGRCLFQMAPPRTTRSGFTAVLVLYIQYFVLLTYYD